MASHIVQHVDLVHGFHDRPCNHVPWRPVRAAWAELPEAAPHSTTQRHDQAAQRPGKRRQDGRVALPIAQRPATVL